MALTLGVIGLGNRVRDMLGTIVSLRENVCVGCVADIDPDGARERLIASGIPHEGMRMYGSAQEMLALEKPDAIIIGTRCNLHAKMADLVIRAGFPLFLEKPVFTTDEDAQLLEKALAVRKKPVVVSFPLRMTPIAQAAKEIIDSGTLGSIAHVSAVNTVNYGRGYYKKWYRDGSITGGMFLQKATHDLDLIFYLLGCKPVSLCAMESRAVMGGNMPAGISCDDCKKRRTCPESDWSLENYGEKAQPHVCTFGEEIDIHDAGSVLVMLDNGAHASYTQCFVARKQANRRLTRIVGLRATLELDFATDVLTVYHHTCARVDRYEFTSKGAHSGGDPAMLSAFIRAVRGEEVVYATLEDGIISARTCLRAQQYAQRKPFIDCN